MIPEINLLILQTDQFSFKRQYFSSIQTYSQSVYFMFISSAVSPLTETLQQSICTSRKKNSRRFYANKYCSCYTNNISSLIRHDARDKKKVE